MSGSRKRKREEKEEKVELPAGRETAQILLLRKISSKDVLKIVLDYLGEYDYMKEKALLIGTRNQRQIIDEIVRGPWHPSVLGIFPRWTSYHKICSAKRILLLDMTLEEAEVLSQKERNIYDDRKRMDWAIYGMKTTEQMRARVTDYLCSCR